MKIEVNLHMYDKNDQLVAVQSLSAPTEATIERIMDRYPEVTHSEIKRVYVK